jgi:hypothetical protein
MHIDTHAIALLDAVADETISDRRSSSQPLTENIQRRKVVALNKSTKLSFFSRVFGRAR